MLDAYKRTHSQIPSPLAGALRAAGVINWNIWSDGLILFHSIETVEGPAAMQDRMRRSGFSDPEWSRRIAELVDDADDSSVELDLVWAMNAGAQSSTRALR